MRVEYRHFQTCKLSKEFFLLCDLSQEVKQTRERSRKEKTQGHENRTPDTGETQGVPMRKGKEVPGRLRTRAASSQSRPEQERFPGWGKKRADSFDYTENYI